MTSYKETPLHCTRDGLNIVGRQLIPEGDGPFPAVIISHGFTNNFTSVLNFCRKFAENGYASFCFSFCGGGKTEQPEGTASDGATTDMTLSSEAADLLAVKDYVVSLPEVDREHLSLCGFSQGGFVSGLTAAKIPDEICNLMMVYPAICIPDHARAGHLGGASYDVNHVPDEIPCMGTVVGRALHEEAAAMDPYLALSCYTGPVLIFHGLEDPLVNYSYSVKAKETAYAPGQCHLQLIEKMGHHVDEDRVDPIFNSMFLFLESSKGKQLTNKKGS